MSKTTISLLPSHPTPPLRIFQNFVNFNYWICLIPFSIKFNRDTQLFSAVCSKWQKRISKSIHILIVLLIFRVGFSDLELMSARNPNGNSSFQKWMSGIQTSFWWLFIIATVCTLDFQGENIISFLNQLQAIGSSLPTVSASKENPDYEGIEVSGIKATVATLSKLVSVPSLSSALFDSRIVWLLTLILITSSVLSAVQDWVIFLDRNVSQNIDTVNGLNTSYYKLSRNFLMDRASTTLFGRANYSESIEENFSWLDYGITAACVGINFAANNLTFAGYYLVMCVSLISWATVRVWVDNLKKRTPCRSELKRTLNSLNDLLRAFDLSEEAFGNIYFASCVGLIPSYAMQLPDLFTSNQKMQLHHATLMFQFLCIVIPAASLNSQIKSIQTWILRSYSNNNGNLDFVRTERDDNLNCRVNLLVQKINFDGFGLSGKLFTITYGFIANILSAVVTFAIICIQFKNQN